MKIKEKMMGDHFVDLNSRWVSSRLMVVKQHEHVHRWNHWSSISEHKRKMLSWI